MDLATVDYVGMCERGCDVDILHPLTGEKTDIKINIQGYLAPNIAARVKAATDEQKTIDVLSDITLGWSGISENCVDIAFSKEEAMRIYARYPFIRKQIMEALFNLENFIVASEKS